MNKNSKYIIGAIVILLISTLIYFGNSSFSIIDQNDNINNCRFVKENNVCKLYTECSYDSNRDISCIKGYEIKSNPDMTPTGELTKDGYTEYVGEENEVNK